jgi:predicted ATPase
MLFEISNIGKIQKAAIEMRGITVIAGNNNTGKSTYGKILYCMFNAFRDAENSILKERRHTIEDIITRHSLRFRHGGQIRILVNNILEHQPSKEEIRSLLEDAMNNKIIFIDKDEDFIDNILDKITQSNEITDRQIQEMILTRFLRAEFGDRIIHVNHAEEGGTISLTII